MAESTRRVLNNYLIFMGVDEEVKLYTDEDARMVAETVMLDRALITEDSSYDLGFTF